MNINLRFQPFYKYFLVLIAGILLERTGFYDVGVEDFLCLVISAFFLWFVPKTGFSTTLKTRLVSATGLIIIFLTGLLVSAETHIHFHKIDGNSHVVKITSIIKEDAKVIEASAKVVSSSDFPQVKINIDKHSGPQRVLAGDLFKAPGRIFMPDKMRIPGAFDYRDYLLNEGYSGLLYVKGNKLDLLAREDGLFYTIKNSIYSIRYKIRNAISNDLGFKRSDSKAIVTALLLGDRSDLEDDLEKQYATLGLLHVLAVSGMHVGLVFMLLIWLHKASRFFKKNVPFTHLILMAFGVFVLWGYALLSGSAPSVCRAAFMFTLIWIGKCLDKNHSVLNSVFASAFFLCLFNPSNLFRLSFQLSYAAVLGIVLLYPKLNRLYGSQFSWLNNIFKLVNVSLAAQIATFPLMLYHFGYWSPLSLLVNIPMAILIPLYLYGGWLMVLLEGCGIGLSFIAFSFDFLIKYQHIIMNYLTEVDLTFYFPKPGISEFVIFSIGILFVINFIAGYSTKSTIKVISLLFAVLIFSAFATGFQNEKNSILLIRLKNEIFLLNCKSGIAERLNNGEEKLSEFQKGIIKSVYRYNGGAGKIRIREKDNDKSQNVLIKIKEEGRDKSYLVLTEENKEVLFKERFNNSIDAIILIGNNRFIREKKSASKEKRIKRLTLREYQSLTLSNLNENNNF